MNQKQKWFLAIASLCVIFFGTFLLVYNQPKSSKTDVAVEMVEAEDSADELEMGESVADQYEMSDDEKQAMDFLNDGYLDDVQVRSGHYYKLLDVLNAYVESYLYLNKRNVELQLESGGDYSLSVPDISARGFMEGVDIAYTDRALYIDLLNEQIGNYSAAQSDLLEDIYGYHESLEDGENTDEGFSLGTNENYQLTLQYEQNIRYVIQEKLANL